MYTTETSNANSNQLPTIQFASSTMEDISQKNKANIALQFYLKLVENDEAESQDNEFLKILQEHLTKFKKKVQDYNWSNIIVEIINTFAWIDAPRSKEELEGETPRLCSLLEIMLVKHSIIKELIDTKAVIQGITEQNFPMLDSPDAVLKIVQTLLKSEPLKNIIQHQLQSNNYDLIVKMLLATNSTTIGYIVDKISVSSDSFLKKLSNWRSQDSQDNILITACLSIEKCFRKYPELLSDPTIAEKHFDILRKLLEYPEIKALAQEENAYKIGPLFWITAYKQADLEDLFIQLGAKMPGFDTLMNYIKGNLLEHCMRHNMHLDVIEKLTDQYTITQLLNEPNANGVSPFSYCLFKLKKDYFEWCFERGGDILGASKSLFQITKEDFKLNFLMTWAKYGKIKEIEKLLCKLIELGIRPRDILNLQSDTKETVLSYALRNYIFMQHFSEYKFGNPTDTFCKLVTLFLKNGAELKIADQFDQFLRTYFSKNSRLVGKGEVLLSDIQAAFNQIDKTEQMFYKFLLTLSKAIINRLHSEPGISLGLARDFLKKIPRNSRSYDQAKSLLEQFPQYTVTPQDQPSPILISDTLKRSTPESPDKIKPQKMEIEEGIKKEAKRPKNQ